MAQTKGKDMQPLKNERHETFAQLVALGTSHQSAYVSAGYAKRAAPQCAARLLTDAKISARIRWLQERAAERNVITLESLLADAQRCRDLGIWHGQINAAVLAVKELGILSGFRVEKRVTQRIDPATISDEELAAIIRAGAPIDVEAVRTEARERLEQPRRQLESSPQPAGNVGRNAGINAEGLEENATISKANGSDAVPGRGIAPAERTVPDPLDDLDHAPPPGTIERRIRAIRGRPTRSRKSDAKSKG